LVAFCSRTAAATSSTVMPSWAIFCGSRLSSMENSSSPYTRASPTRQPLDLVLQVHLAVVAEVHGIVLGSSEVSAATSRMSLLAFLMVIPFWRTGSGSCGSATAMAFCTSTAARSWFPRDVEVHRQFHWPSPEFADW